MSSSSLFVETKSRGEKPETNIQNQEVFIWWLVRDRVHKGVKGLQNLQVRVHVTVICESYSCTSTFLYVSTPNWFGKH